MCVKCGAAVEVTPHGTYTPQVVVTYSGCGERFTYCSGRCVNADYARSSAVAEGQSHFLAQLEAALLNEVFDAHVAALAENAGRELARLWPDGGWAPQRADELGLQFSEHWAVHAESGRWPLDRAGRSRGGLLGFEERRDLAYDYAVSTDQADH